VTKQTTLLVVGDQDVRKLAGHKVSTKHRKAEELIADGQPLRMLSESDWLALAGDSANRESGTSHSLTWTQ
jgi:DNA polymerase III subunit epsilon